MLRITVGPWECAACLEEEAGPKTCAAFKKLLPLHNKFIQARWIGAWRAWGSALDRVLPAERI